MSFDREKVRLTLAALAEDGIYVGTSSWKYPGWRHQLYDEARYVWRGKFAESRFEKNCLTEYAQVFKTVCVDAAYYRFPEKHSLEKLAAEVPADFRFGFKITDAITIKRFSNLPRHGARAGQPNGDFLNADLFSNSFLGPCEHIREKVGVLIFEFSRFAASDYEHGRNFVADLDQFFSKLPSGWPYAVEMRNRHWLIADYFACLAKHGITHVFNSWDAMPAVSEQMALSGSLTNPKLATARFLLKPGRNYTDAVKMFQPYDRVQEENHDARAAGRALIAQAKAAGTPRKTLIYVNNRLEGNALETINAMLKTDSADPFQ